MKMYTDYQGKNPLSGVVIKELILEGDFLYAWYIVNVYILKMDVSPFHKKLMAHRVSSDNTLTMAGRGLGKSFTLTTGYCLTHMLRDCNISIVIMTATAGHSTDFVREIGAYFNEGQIIHEIFGNLKGEKWTESELILKRDTNKLDSTILASSMGSPSGVIGKHPDIIILDDIVDSKNNSTRYMRDKMENTLHQSIFPALSIFSQYQYIHVVGTHYHPDDMYTRFENSNTFKTLKIPSLIKDSTEKEGFVCIWRNAPEKAIERIFSTKENRPLAFEQQYQQIVRKGDGGIFKPEWFDYFHKYEHKNGRTYIYVEEENGKEKRIEVDVYGGVDLAISQRETADYFVFAVVGIDKNQNVYILDFNRGRYTFEKQKETIKQMARKWEGIQRIGIETVAYQQALFQELSRETSLPLTRIQTVNDKVSRLNVFGAMFENEKVLFYSHIENTADMVNEFLEFPDAEHDDIPDAICMAWETGKKNKNNNNRVQAGPNLGRLGWGGM